MEREVFGVLLPIDGCVDFVKIFATLVAEIFVWGCFGAKDTNASTVLPHFTNVALDEEARNILCQLNRREKVGVRPFNGWTPGIVLRVTYTPHSLVFFVLSIVTGMGRVQLVLTLGLLWFFFVAAFASAPKKSVLVAFQWFRGQGRTRCRLARGRLVVGSVVALGAA